VLENRRHLDVGERLANDAIALILESDTTWFGTTYAASNEAQHHPSHLGMNHRGGRPGFIRVKPSDGRTVVLPDYSGKFVLLLQQIKKRSETIFPPSDQAIGS
jgi:hypothetical protein